MKTTLTILNFIVAFLLTACFAPYVGHSSIDGSVRAVKNWRVEYERAPGQGTSVDELLGAAIEPSTKYHYEDSAKPYIDEIRQLLRIDHDMTIASNFPTHGTIKIRLYGTATSQFMPMDTNIVPRSVREDIALDPIADPSQRFSAVSDGEPTEAKLRRDRVTKAHVIIYDENGNLSGEIFVGRKTEDNIKPDYLAKVIAKVINEGRW